MISTITTTAITSVSSIAVLGLSAGISIAVVVALVAFLTTKELASSGGSSSMRIGRFLSVGIIPLLMVFTVVVAGKITEILT